MNKSEKNKYLKTVLSEKRLMEIKPAKGELSDENLVKAMTVNENLKAWGYTLKPRDIVKLSKSKSLDNFVIDFEKLLDEIPAKPMYPDFPKQVMNIDEAVFRFHQMLHYFSTYGMEFLYGEPVLKGWLPDVEDTEKVENDEKLLPEKVIELAEGIDIFKKPLLSILAKRERMTLPEHLIVEGAMTNVSKKTIQNLEIPFKENFLTLSYMILNTYSREDAVETLFKLCQHSGDAFRVANYYIGKKHYKLRTSQKKTLVKLLDKFENIDFESNLLLSNKKSKKVHIMLNYLDFSLYSRNKAHLESVRMFRNGELQSWQGKVEYLLLNNKDEALDVIAKRPGMMLRMVSRLIRLGYNPQDIETRLKAGASQLSTQTLITVLNKLTSTEEGIAVGTILKSVLIEKFKNIKLPFESKKVFIDEGLYSFKYSRLNCNDKSEQGGYIQSGLAYKIPENVDYLRFFVYWNSDERVDLDLHAKAVTKDDEFFEISYYSNFRKYGIVHSGDVVESDAAEFIDIDLKAPLSKVLLSINSFTGQLFKNIETCFTGMLAVKSLDETVKLYNKENCFFSHNLEGRSCYIKYGVIDVENRILSFDGTEGMSRDIRASFQDESPVQFSLLEYLNILLSQNNVEIVQNKEDADYIITLDKSLVENGISLIDNNFYFDE